MGFAELSWCWAQTRFCGCGMFVAVLRGRGVDRLQRERSSRRLSQLESRLSHFEEKNTVDHAGDNAELIVHSLSGKSWRLQTTSGATGADLRARVAALADVPDFEVNLVFGTQRIGDYDRLYNVVPEDWEPAVA